MTVTLKSDVPVVLKKSQVKCKVSRIAFPHPLDQVADWDDRMRTVTWVDSGKGAAGQHHKKKVSFTLKPLINIPLCASYLVTLYRKDTEYKTRDLEIVISIVSSLAYTHIYTKHLLFSAGD